MFSLITYGACVIACLLASGKFYRALKKNVREENYRDFALFFFILGVSFMPYLFILAVGSNAQRLILEIAHFLVIMSFSVLIRPFIRFQHSNFNPNLATSLVVAVAVIKSAVSIFFPADPMVQGMLIYWHIPWQNSLAFNVPVVLLNIAMGSTLLTNIKRLKVEKKSMMLYLGLTLLVGAGGGLLVTSTDAFHPLLYGYVFLLCAAISLSLFAIKT